MVSADLNGYNARWSFGLLGFVILVREEEPLDAVVAARLGLGTSGGRVDCA